MRKYLELFINGFDETITDKIKVENKPYIGYSLTEGKLVYTVIPKPATSPADNEIWYTTVDGSLIQTSAPMDSEWAMMFGTPVVSNTYSNGSGVLLFENDLTKIGDFSITGSNLQSIIIPSKVNTINKDSTDAAFASCRNLASITVVDNNSTYDSRENCNAIIETASNTLIQGCKNTIIPDSVTSIGTNAFYYCKDLTSITITDSVTSIEEGAFWDSGLTSVTIPNSITSIKDYTFSDCSSLTSVTIPNSVTSIGTAFNSCTSLTSIIFEGTMEEWKNIEKSGYWIEQVPATHIQCTDGQVSLY
jgi:hypothetical protein